MNPTPVDSVLKNEWCTRNHLGQILCRLCSTTHRDEANFAVHLSGKSHRTNLLKIEALRESKEQEHATRRAIMQQRSNEAHVAAMEKVEGSAAALSAAARERAAVAAARRAPTVGRPVVRHQIEQVDPEQLPPSARSAQMSLTRVTFRLEYPLAEGRPLHRWMNTYEQRVEPRDDAKMYLVFACEPYETVSFVFPSGLRMSTADNSDPSDIQRYYCRWDATDRSYTLIFILGKELP